MNEHTTWELWTPLSPEQVIRALTDFDDDRARTWRETSHPDIYEVHAEGPGWTEVTEGVPYAWSRERYDWSRPGVVELRQLDSNIADPAGGRIVYTIGPDGGGSTVHCDRHRSFRGTRAGRLAAIYMRILGPWILRRQFAAGLRRVGEATQGSAR